LAKELNVPPGAGLPTGSYESWRDQAFPRPYPITITFGKPFRFEALLRKKGSRLGAKMIMKQAVLGIREEVVKLKK